MPSKKEQGCPLVINKPFISVDPGMHIAVQSWNAEGVPQTSYIITTKYKTTGEVIYDLSKKFGSILDSTSDIEVMIIEAMDVRASSAVSMAAGGRGNLSRLAYIIGALICVAESENILVPEPVTFTQWGGQLNYNQLRFILKNHFDFDSKTEHEAAAYGIGLWALGRL